MSERHIQESTTPRGFEFEITIPNLLWILENCDCIKGKGLEGQFVYGWDGKELVLVPVESPDYKEIQAKNKVIHNNEFIKAKDLILGATYETLNNEQYVYMGKYNCYDTRTNYYNRPSYWNRNIEEGWDIPLDETWYDDIVFGDKDRRYKSVNMGKQFWFIKLGNPDADWYMDREDRITVFKSITKKFSKLVRTECEKYPEYYEMMENNQCYSPIDYGKSKILPTSFEDFASRITDRIVNDKGRFELFHLVDGRLERLEVHYGYTDATYTKRDYYWIEKVPLGYNWMGHPQYNEVKHFINIDEDFLKKFYKEFKPMYGEQYLENGKLYLRRGYYGTEE